MQAPLESTTKSCSLGCKLPPPFTFGEVVNFQIHTQSLLLLLLHTPPTNEVAKTILVVLALDSPATPVRHRIQR